MNDKKLYDKVRPTLDRLGWPPFLTFDDDDAWVVSNAHDYSVGFLTNGYFEKEVKAVVVPILEGYLTNKFFEKEINSSIQTGKNGTTVYNDDGKHFCGDTLLDALILALEEK